MLAACSKRSDTGPGVTITEKPGRIAGFGGRIVERDGPAYEKWRQAMVWQMRKPDRFPEIILQPRNLSDVQAATRFGRGEGMRIAVRSGGHNIWAASLRDGGMLLDMSYFRQYSVAAAPGTARLGPALWARDVLEALAQHDAGFPVAHCATVPLGGFVLGGGLGLNGDEWGGMACNCILGGTLVTADGDAVEVSEKHNADLLWAMRGGVDALPGVVTELAVKTFHRPRQVFSSTYVFPLAALDVGLDLLQQMAAMKPRNTEILALMTHNPQAGSEAPLDVRKVIAVRAQVYADETAQAAPVLDAIAAIPAAKQSVFSLPSIPESYERLFIDSMDWRRGFGFGRFAVDNAWTDDIRAAVEAIAAEFMQTPSWKSHVVVQPKLAPATIADAAFSVAGNTYIGIYSVWDDAAQDEAGLSWLRRMSGHLKAYAVGHYINEINAGDDPDRIRRCYSSEAWERLRAIRDRWDPQRVMHDFPGLS